MGEVQRGRLADVIFLCPSKGGSHTEAQAQGLY